MSSVPNNLWLKQKRVIESFEKRDSSVLENLALSRICVHPAARAILVCSATAAPSTQKPHSVLYNGAREKRKTLPLGKERE